MATRTYEVMYIAEPETTDDTIAELNKAIEKLVTDSGGNVVKTDVMGPQRMAYPIRKREDGYYVLFEIEGSGQEIAELERRMRVNDIIMRYLTVRVDEERKTADKLTAKRDKKHARVTAMLGGTGAQTEENDNEQGGDE
ncbi:MAG: 30S ribosomal protein S6 [Pyrinomonadaceae bacterium]|nr:30S ribosomal protein S6 [Pyrinomonadaceae bacterium]